MLMSVVYLDLIPSETRMSEEKTSLFPAVVSYYCAWFSGQYPVGRVVEITGTIGEENKENCGTSTPKFRVEYHGTSTPKFRMEDHGTTPLDTVDPHRTSTPRFKMEHGTSPLDASAPPGSPGVVRKLSFRRPSGLLPRNVSNGSFVMVETEESVEPVTPLKELTTPVLKRGVSFNNVSSPSRHTCGESVYAVEQPWLKDSKRPTAIKA